MGIPPKVSGGQEAFHELQHTALRHDERVVCLHNSKGACACERCFVYPDFSVIVCAEPGKVATVFRIASSPRDHAHLQWTLGSRKSLGRTGEERRKRVPTQKVHGNQASHLVCAKRACVGRRQHHHTTNGWTVGEARAEHQSSHAVGDDVDRDPTGFCRCLLEVPSSPDPQLLYRCELVTGGREVNRAPAREEQMPPNWTHRAPGS